MTRLSKHDQERAIRRQQFAQQLADVERAIGFRPSNPPPAQSPVAETHPALKGHPGPMLAMARHNHAHERAFQQMVFQAEWAMHHRTHFGNISDVIDKVALGTLHLYFENGAEGIRKMVNIFLSKNADDTILRQAAARLLHRDEPEAAQLVLSS